MAYAYKLETLLTYRRNLEELAQQKFGREQHLLNMHRIRLDDLSNERRNLVAVFEERKKRRMNSAYFSFYMDSIRVKDQQIIVQKNTIESQKNVVETARKQLFERVKDRKIIEKAKEKDYQQYLLDSRRKEQNISDEQAVLRFGREPV